MFFQEYMQTKKKKKKSRVSKESRTEAQIMLFQGDISPDHTGDKRERKSSCSYPNKNSPEVRIWYCTVSSRNCYCINPTFISLTKTHEGQRSVWPSCTALLILQISDKIRGSYKSAQVETTLGKHQLITQSAQTSSVKLTRRS